MAVRGFVLIVDAVIATILLGIFIVIITSELAIAPQPNYLFKTSSDLLAAMDNAGHLRNISSQTNNQAQALLQLYGDSLPANTGVNFTVNIYTYNNGFSLSRAVNYTKGAKTSEVASVRRLFVDPATGNYGIAYLEVWYV